MKDSDFQPGPDKPSCGKCGHAASEHEVVTAGVPDGIGRLHLRGWLSRCMHVEHQAGRPPAECTCGGYVPDRFSRVTKLLGFDVRRIIG